MFLCKYDGMLVGNLETKLTHTKYVEVRNKNIPTKHLRPRCFQFQAMEDGHDFAISSPGVPYRRAAILRNISFEHIQFFRGFDFCHYGLRGFLRRSVQMYNRSTRRAKPCEKRKGTETATAKTKPQVLTCLPCRGVPWRYFSVPASAGLGQS